MYIYTRGTNPLGVRVQAFCIVYLYKAGEYIVY